MYRRVVCTALVMACCALGACSSDGADGDGTPTSSNGEAAAAVDSCDLLDVTADQNPGASDSSMSDAPGSVTPSGASMA